MSIMHDLNGFQRDLLYTISALENPTGAEIKTNLEQRYTTDIGASRIYSNLNKLAEKGYIRKDNKNALENEYQLTEQANRLIADHLYWIEDCHTSPKDHTLNKND